MLKNPNKHATLETMPSKYGKPGDVLFKSPVGILAFAELTHPKTTIDPRGQWSAGLRLSADDLAAVERVLIETFQRAFPGTSGRLKIPVRPDRQGVRHLFAKTTIKPVLIGLDGEPTERIEPGSRVRLLCRLCPWIRDGRKGVSVFLNGVEQAPELEREKAATVPKKASKAPPAARPCHQKVPTPSERALKAATRPRIGFDSPAVTHTQTETRH